MAATGARAGSLFSADDEALLRELDGEHHGGPHGAQRPHSTEGETKGDATDLPPPPGRSSPQRPRSPSPGRASPPVGMSYAGYKFLGGSVAAELERQRMQDSTRPQYKVSLVETDDEGRPVSSGPQLVGVDSDAPFRLAPTSPAGESKGGAEETKGGGGDGSDSDAYATTEAASEAASDDASEAEEEKGGDTMAALAPPPPGGGPMNLLAHIGGQRGASLRNFTDEKLDEYFQKMRDQRTEFGKNAWGLVLYVSEYAHMQDVDVVSDRGFAAYNILTERLLCCYPVEHVRRCANATVDQFESAMSFLAARTNEESVVTLIIMARGGRIRRGLHRGSYILCSDTPWSRASASATAQTSISLKRLEAAITALPTKKVTLFLDIAHVHELDSIQESVFSKRALRVRNDFPELVHKKCGVPVVAPLQLAMPDVEGALPGDQRDFSHDLLNAISGGAVQVHDEVYASAEDVVKWMQDVTMARVDARRRRLRKLVERGKELKAHKELAKAGRRALRKYTAALKAVDELCRDDDEERARRAKVGRHMGALPVFGDFSACNPLVCRPLHPKVPSQPTVESRTLSSLTMVWDVPKFWGMPIQMIEMQLRGLGRANSEWVTISSDQRAPHRFKHSFTHLPRLSKLPTFGSAYLGDEEVEDFPGRKVDKRAAKNAAAEAKAAGADGKAGEQWSDDDSDDDESSGSDEGEEAEAKREERRKKKAMAKAMAKAAKIEAAKKVEDMAEAMRLAKEKAEQEALEAKLRPAPAVEPPPRYRIASLVPDAGYHVRLRVCNLGGWSPWSEESELLYTWKAQRQAVEERVKEASEDGPRALVRLIQSEPLSTHLHYLALRQLAGMADRDRARDAIMDEDGAETCVKVMRTTPSHVGVQARAAFLLAKLADVDGPLLDEPVELLREVVEVCDAALGAHKYDVPIVNACNLVKRLLAPKLKKKRPARGRRRSSVDSRVSAALFYETPVIDKP